MNSLIKLALAAGGAYLAYEWTHPGTSLSVTGLTPAKHGDIPVLGPSKRPVSVLGPTHRPMAPLHPGSKPLSPLGPPSTSPLTPSKAPMKGLGGAAGYCIGVTDRAYAPYAPNVKNPCSGQTWGWHLIASPSTTQCKTFIDGSYYSSGMGGCMNKPGGQQLFLVQNNFIQ